MKLNDAEELAEVLLGEHSLDAWTFEFDKAVRRFGACHYRTKRITLSRALTELNDEAHVRNTLLHEIAHALAGARAGHGPVWKQIARQIGCDAQRLYSSAIVKSPPPKFIGRCPRCEYTVARNKRAHVACLRCMRSDHAHRSDAWLYRIAWTRNSEA